MTEEHRIQNKIRAETPGCVLFRANAGDFWQGTPVYSKEYGQTILINMRRVEGLPEGFSDLFGVRLQDGKAIFIEVKTPRGKATAEQKHFLQKMRAYGALSGICRSVVDAINLIKERI